MTWWSRLLWELGDIFVGTCSDHLERLSNHLEQSSASNRCFFLASICKRKKTKLQQQLLQHLSPRFYQFIGFALTNQIALSSPVSCLWQWPIKGPAEENVSNAPNKLYNVQRGKNILPGSWRDQFISWSVKLNVRTGWLKHKCIKLNGGVGKRNNVFHTSVSLNALIKEYNICWNYSC